MLTSRPIGVFPIGISPREAKLVPSNIEIVPPELARIIWSVTGLYLLSLGPTPVGTIVNTVFDAPSIIVKVSENPFETYTLLLI